MSGLRAASKLDELGDSVRSVIRAYHGSPYDFDRFDARHIGAGEGNQSYGHGLYFSSNESVARQYRDDLADTMDQELPHEMSEELNWWFKEMNDLAGKSHDWARANPQAANNPFSDSLKSATDAYGKARLRADAATQNPGRLYEVEIGHPEDSLLNWDRPAAPAGGVGAKAAEVLRAVRPRDIDAGTLEYIQSVRPGQYQRPAYGSSVDAVERALQRLALDRDGAAELRRAGIPGVKYLDGVSRQHGSGSRNYVVFPGAEDQIRILRKY